MFLSKSAKAVVIASEMFIHRRAYHSLRTLSLKSTNPFITSRHTYRRQFLSNDTKDASTDLSLQESFTDYNRVKIIFKAILNSKSLKEINNLVENDIAVGFSNGLLLYADLQNPLLVKYEFNIQDFRDGVKDAIHSIWMTAASQDFFEYCNGMRSSSESANYLIENCHPDVYNSFASVAQSLYATNIRGIRINEWNIDRFVITRVQTLIQDDDIVDPPSLVSEIFSSNEALLRDIKITVKDVNVNASNDTGAQPSVKVDSKSRKDWIRNRFPIGSVVASVTVVLDSHELGEFDFINENGSKHLSANEMKLTSEITLHGVISGQTELEWKIWTLSTILESK